MLINRIGSYGGALTVIEHDVSTVSGVGSGATLTWSHTVGSKTNRLLVVCVFASDYSAIPAISGVTYNGVAMTKAREDYLYGGASSIWMLHNPPSGAHNVVVSKTTGSVYMGVSSSFAGAQQSSSPNAANGLTSPTAGAKSFSLTPTVDNCWIIEVAGHADGDAYPTISLASGFTAAGSLTGTFPYSRVAAGYYGPKTPAGAVSCGATIGSSSSPYACAISAISIAPAT